MHLFESWTCKPKLAVKAHHKNDFDASAQKDSTYSIHVVCESEMDTNHKSFAYAANIFGEIRPSILYPAQSDSKKFFLLAPTQSEPKKLSLEGCGRAHVASHFGAHLAHAILAFPAAKNTHHEFCVTLSDGMKNIVKGAEHEFLLGLLQRSISYKIKKIFSEKHDSQHTVILNSELFTDESFHKAHAMSKAMSVTRTLINMPANVLNPETYEDCVRFLISEYNTDNASNISMEVLDNEKLKELGCGLICAVGQGSAVAPRIVKLSYQPSSPHANPQPKHVCLVGKGITFDSGGYDLKPASGMRAMKKDMGGSAAVLGVFLASVQLKLPLKLTCYLALAENMISGNAMRPGDIYKAYNGLHVEIDNTDAEGRLVLADALSLAVEQKPDWIIDLATLTGAARTALGPLVDSAFGNRAELNGLLNDVSLQTGDWIWNMPLPTQYDAYFDSRIADIMNSTATPYGGAITAALFLQKFVGTCAWSHIDTFMWCDRAQGLWAEDNAPTAKCVRLVVGALQML